MEDVETKEIVSTEIIELTKNAKGKFQYKIKVIGTLRKNNSNILSDDDLKHIDKISKHLEDNYGLGVSK